MSDLYRVFGAKNADLQIETDFIDPITKVENFFNFSQNSQGLDQSARVKNCFVKLEYEGLGERWDDICLAKDIPAVKALLSEALDYLESISDENGNLVEPYRSRFKELEQDELWETGFFYWEREDQIRPREFIPVVTHFIDFIDKVIVSGADLLRRSDD